MPEPLTTVWKPEEEFGRKVVQFIMCLMPGNRHAREKIRLEPKLVERSSTIKYEGDYEMSVWVIGSINQDITVLTRKMPAHGETVLGSSVEYHSGGKGGNQAVAAACAGAETHMIGAVGDDASGIFLLEKLSQRGVRTEGIKIMQGETSGCAFITVDASGENSIIVIPGTNRLVSCEMAEACSREFQTGDILLMQGEIPSETVLFVLELARRMGVITILNPAPPFPLHDSIYPKIDYLTPNEKEACLLSGVDGNPEEQAEYFLKKGTKNVIITLGSRGVIFSGERGKYIIPAYRSEAVDTTGAGDCLNGFFGGCLSQGIPVEKALRCAVIAAGISVTLKGAQDAVPLLETVLGLFNEQQDKVRVTN